MSTNNTGGRLAPKTIEPQRGRKAAINSKSEVNPDDKVVNRAITLPGSMLGRINTTRLAFCANFEPSVVINFSEALRFSLNTFIDIEPFVKDIMAAKGFTAKTNANDTMQAVREYVIESVKKNLGKE